MKIRDCLQLVQGSLSCPHCGSNPPPYYRRWEAKFGPIDVSVAEVTPGEWQTLVSMRVESTIGPYYDLSLSREFTEHSWETVIFEIGCTLSWLKAGCQEAIDHLVDVEDLEYFQRA